MNNQHKRVMGLPGVVIEPSERDVLDPIRRDYELEIGFRDGLPPEDAKAGDPDSFVLVTVTRGATALIEVMLKPDEARLMAAKLLELADNVENPVTL